MRAGRIATAGLALTGLVLGVGLVASWLAIEPRVVEAAPPARALPDAEASKSVSRPLPDSVAETASARLEAEAEIAVPASAPDEPRACQDLDAALKELCDLLVQAEGAFPFHVEPRLAAVGSALDEHCAAILSNRAADASRATVERLAALCLLRSAPPALQIADLGEAERATLWNLFDLTRPDDVLAASEDVDANEARQHRDAVAHLAATCLAALGGEQDLLRLMEALDGPHEQAVAALRAFELVHNPVASQALLTRLADRTRSMERVARILVNYLDRAELELDPELRERAAQALVERWRAHDHAGTDVADLSRMLAHLDPSLLAQRWGELQDEGGLGTHANLAAAAWVARASTSDLSRLDGWLGHGSPAERLIAARAVLLHAVDGTPAAELRAASAAALEEIARACPDPSLRREALFSSHAAPEHQVALVSRALQDEDASVRAAAASTSRTLLKKDPALRAQVERVAASDQDEGVRRAARLVLR